MQLSENVLKNLSMNKILKMVRNEKDPIKKEIFRNTKSQKLLLGNKKMLERIKVIDNNLISDSGFIPYDEKLKYKIEKNMKALERSYAEYDERYRQIICNGLLITRDPKSGDYLYGFQKRNKSYNEKTLIGTLGMVGGHMNVSDNSLYEGLIREMGEELKNFSFENLKIVPKGYIKQACTKSISDYHICALYYVYMPYNCARRIKNKETQENLHWIPSIKLEQYLKTYNGFDSWVKIIIENLII